MYTDAPGYGYSAPVVSDVAVEARVGFIRQTYAHLAGAVALFVALEFALYQLPVAHDLALTMTGGWNWLMVLGVFMVASYVANKWALSATSLPLQYAGLALYTGAMALISFPLIYVAARFGGPDVLPTAAIITLAMFAALTLVVFVTKQDFSFLRGILMVGGLAAMGLIVCSILFGFSLGTIFTVAMIALMCGYILYDTSNVLHHYRVGQHVAAALALFSTLATLFWYVLRFVMAASADD